MAKLNKTDSETNQAVPIFLGITILEIKLKWKSHQVKICQKCTDGLSVNHFIVAILSNNFYWYNKVWDRF